MRFPLFDLIKPTVVGGGKFSKPKGGQKMDRQFYSARDISDIMGICYAKALAFIKYSGVEYVRINNVYLVEMTNFHSFIKENKHINVEV